MNAMSPPVIFEPGVYDMPSDRYHADPCDTPSLSAGMITELLIAPKKCWAASRRLNPDWEEPESQDKFTIGTVSHVMFLEPHLFAEKVMVCPYDDWRSKAAKEAKADALASGVTPILEKHMRKVRAARTEFHTNKFTAGIFANGRTEQSMFWRHPVYGFWCRARPDFLADGFAYMADYKATANADPMEFGRHAANMGYHRRAAWYLEGARALFPRVPDHYWFCNQEVKSPYLVSKVELDMASLEDGQAENDKAAEVFDACLRTGDWYGYRHKDDTTRDNAFEVGIPPWAHMKIEARI